MVSRSLQVTAMSVGLTLAVLSMIPADILAQHAPPGLVEVRDADGGRRGFWFALGLGAGGESNDVVGSGYSDLYYQPTISVRAGGTVNQHLRLGGEFLSWFDEQGDAVATLTSALVTGQLYPLTHAGLYFKAGLGLGRNAIEFQDGYGVGDTGFAGILGTGYELRLGRRLYLNPTVDLVGHSYSSRVSGGYTERLVNFGLSLVFQTGR
jgi:hypothetical protein